MAAWHAVIGSLIDAVGTDTYVTTLLDVLGSGLEFDYSVAFAYHERSKPVDLYDTFPTKKREILVTQYKEGPYLLDPFFQACWRIEGSGVHRIKDLSPSRFAQSEYFLTYYRRAKLSDEMCFMFALNSSTWVVVSLMRRSHRTPFSAAELNVASSLEPIVSALGRQHLAEALVTPDETDSSANQPREREVASLVLQGHSSVSIAEQLNISPATVRTYHRSIHSKLGITSQAELFSLFLREISGSSK